MADSSPSHPGPGPAEPVAGTLDVDAPIGRVATLALIPPAAKALYVLAHGAGAGMTHPVLTAISARLAAHGVASFRFQFPYMEAGRKRPDSERVLLGTIQAAIAAARARYPALPIVIGGKSMGGRMSSRLLAQQSHPEVRGVIFLGFPLHAAGKPSSARGEHLAQVAAPMLFLQGTRDRLADLDLLGPIVTELGARATLHIVEGGDHSFHVLKRSGRTDEEVHDELAVASAGWLDRVL